MPGCIQPMSSPMMKRMLGFVPWAEAGALAMVVAVHKTTRAPQITLNMLMVASLDVGRRNPGRSLRPTPPTDLASLCIFCPYRIMLRAAVGCLAGRKVAEVLWMRYADSAALRYVCG